MNILDLIRSSNKYRKLEDKGSTPVKGSFKVVYQINLGRLGYEVRMNSLSGKVDLSSKMRPPWKNQILFSNVEYLKFSDIPDNERGMNIWHESNVLVGKGLGNWWFKLPSLKNECKVMCTCPSARHEFTFQNNDKKALVGGTNWAKYTRKTPPKKRPKNPQNPNKLGGRDFVNPNNYQGLCHHQVSLITWLLKNNLLKKDD